MNATTGVRFPSAATAAAAAAMLAGCAVPFPVYTVSSSNVASLRAAPRGVQLGDFTGAQSSVSCRLQPIGPEGGRTFGQYIRGAFNDEIVIAGGGVATVPQRRLSLTLREIDVDCAIGTASWTFDVEVRIDGQPPYAVRTLRPFEGSFAGAIVMSRAYQAFVPSVQQLISDVMAHPTYRASFGDATAQKEAAP